MRSQFRDQFRVTHQHGLSKSVQNAGCIATNECFVQIVEDRKGNHLLQWVFQTEILHQLRA